MLSLTKGIHIGTAVNKKNKKDKFNIYYNDEMENEPDLDVDNLGELINDEDYDIIERKYGLNLDDVDEIRELFIKKINPKEVKKNKIRNGYRKLHQYLKDKLKGEIDLTNTPYIIKPVIDKHPGTNHIGHIAIIGATGSGKTTWAKNTIMDLYDRDKRKIYLVSRKTNDPSLKDLKKLAKKNYIQLDLKAYMDDDSSDDNIPMYQNEIPNFNTNNLYEDMKTPKFPKMEDFAAKSKKDPKKTISNFIIFDDIDTVGNKELQRSIYHLRDDILQVGRGYNIVAFNMSHVLFGNHITKQVLNDSRLIILFPKSSNVQVRKLFQNRFGFGKRKVDKLINKLKQTGRSVIIHTFYPNYLVNDKIIRLF